ncbi:hypothetical protein C8F04DRAFT_1279375 [Mycena alexandri]|uniref:Uncharacterized protein n=1 Tax=Mycena alexandri TaxID=1745969 RepID=A0AAD6RY35_9AGAR|nr:hypothetical protein C8F04DRAFT_1279375 [Mycena alexandri]
MPSNRTHVSAFPWASPFSTHLLDVSDSVCETAMINFLKEGSHVLWLASVSHPPIHSFTHTAARLLQALDVADTGNVRNERAAKEESAAGKRVRVGRCVPCTLSLLFPHYTPLSRAVLRYAARLAPFRGEEQEGCVYLSAPQALFAFLSRVHQAPAAVCKNSHSVYLHLRARRVCLCGCRVRAGCGRSISVHVGPAAPLPPSLRLAPPSLPSHPSAHSDADAMPVCVRAVCIESPRARRRCRVQRGVLGCAGKRAEFARAGKLCVPFSLPFSDSVPYAACRM